MRTNLGDGLIVGLGISGVVLGARWLFGDAFILWQVALIIVGAVVLAGLQMTLERLRAPRTKRKAIIDPATSDPTLLHSPPMAWDPEPQPASQPAPRLPPGQDPVSADAPDAVPEPPSPAQPDQAPILPEPGGEHSPEKMV